MRIGLWCLAGLWLLAGPALAEPTAELKKILETCDRQPDKACEQSAWKFADVSKDKLLSKAEITRFLRLTAALQMVNTRDAEGATEVIAFLLGPYGAQIVLDNFDYDGDGYLTRSELLHDLGVAGMKDFAGRLIASGRDAFQMGSMMAGRPGMMGPGQRQGGVRQPRMQRDSRPMARSDSGQFDPHRAITRQLKGCWRPTLNRQEAANIRLRIRLTLNPDGNIQDSPEILNAGGGGNFDQIADSALQALHDCAPFQLPDDEYLQWRVVELELKAGDFAGR